MTQYFTYEPIKLTEEGDVHVVDTEMRVLGRPVFILQDGNIADKKAMENLKGMLQHFHEKGEGEVSDVQNKRGTIQEGGNA